MEAATLRQIHAPEIASRTPAPATTDDYDWVYDDPDLEPYLAGKRWSARKETPLEAFG